MKDIGMEYQTINKFLNDYIIYYGEGKEDLKPCPNRKINRYRINKVTKNMP